MRKRPIKIINTQTGQEYTFNSTTEASRALQCVQGNLYYFLDNSKLMHGKYKIESADKEQAILSKIIL